MTDAGPDVVSNELLDQFHNDPWPIVGFLTTEHTTLVGLRAASIAESSSRVSALLTAFSASLVALGFVASSTGGFGTGFFAMGALVFGLLVALGVMTFGRCLQTSIEDLRLARRIELVRSTYLALAPGLRDRLRPPETQGPDAARLSTGMDARGKWQLLLTLAGLVSVINGVVAGAAVAFCAELLSAPRPITWSIGFVTGAAATAAETWLQSRAFEAANGPTAVGDETG